MLANALFHIVGGIVDGQYVPGLVTAIVLYLPAMRINSVREVCGAGMDERYSCKEFKMLDVFFKLL